MDWIIIIVGFLIGYLLCIMIPIPKTRYIHKEGNRCKHCGLPCNGDNYCDKCNNNKYVECWKCNGKGRYPFSNWDLPCYVCDCTGKIKIG